jgi:diphosphomevalonate decarboxylase
MSPTLGDTPTSVPLPTGCRAIAHSNIALAKYWGKRDQRLNLPDVPSLSLTLAGLTTSTFVRFDAQLRTDQLVLNGASVDGLAASKAFALLDRVRQTAGFALRARIESSNDFPTASGLASSASGFAALARASVAAAGLDWSPRSLSDLARSASVSAARSIFGGFVTLEAGAHSAQPLEVSAEAERLRMVIAVTERGPKPVSSTSGMLHTQDTSPYYPAWRDAAPRAYAELRAALVEGELDKAGIVMEHSALSMHASMFAARPALIYFNAATLSAIAAVRELREARTFAYFTIDAGPHVKVLTLAEDVDRVSKRLAVLPGVSQVIASGSGDGAHLVEEA